MRRPLLTFTPCYFLQYYVLSNKPIQALHHICLHITSIQAQTISRWFKRTVRFNRFFLTGTHIAIQWKSTGVNLWLFRLSNSITLWLFSERLLQLTKINIMLKEKPILNNTVARETPKPDVIIWIKVFRFKHHLFVKPHNFVT